MRYINIKYQNPPNAWLEKAEEFTSILLYLYHDDEASIDDILYFIDKNEIWKELKQWLSDISHGKCWYSEAREIFSDYDVDHFRPKKRARQFDGTQRVGYWWLAFDWKNYRLSGNIGNRPHTTVGGESRSKSDYFPLRDIKNVADNPDCELSDEEYLLLDPTDQYDTMIMTFDETGKPIPSDGNDILKIDRVKVTNKLLFLDYPALVDERKKVWMKCIKLIGEIETLMKRLESHPSPTINMTIRNRFEELINMKSEESELSSTTIACLLSSGRNWAIRLATYF